MPTRVLIIMAAVTGLVILTASLIQFVIAR